MGKYGHLPQRRHLHLDVHGTNSSNDRYGVPLDNPFVGVAGLVRSTPTACAISGSVLGSSDLTATVLGNLVDLLGYVNFHTTTYGGGEIRGQIIR